MDYSFFLVIEFFKSPQEEYQNPSKEEIKLRSDNLAKLRQADVTYLSSLLENSANALEGAGTGLIF